MSRRRVGEQKSEIWDIFRQNETPPPVEQSEKSAFLPTLSRGSREGLRKEQTPKILPKFEELPHIEIRGRLRELEIQMLDLRSGVDRRLTSISEDFPNRLSKEVKALQDRDSFMWKDNTQKQQQIFESMKFLQETMKISFEQMNLEVSTLRRRLDEVSIKQSSTVRDIEHIAKMPRAIEAPIQNMDYTPLMITFREAMNEERKKREAVQQELGSQIQELHNLLRNNYIEHGKRLQEYRDMTMLTQNETKGQIIGLETTKEEKQKNDQEYIKSVFNNLQRRLEDEVGQRTQLEKEFKMWMDSRLNNFQKIMRTDEKDLVDREAKMLGMIQDGLSALHEIISRVKESSSASVTKVQTLTNESIKDLAQALSSIKDSLYQRIEGIEFSLQEEAKFQVEQSGSMATHIKSLAEKVDYYKTNLENSIMSTENRLKSILYDMQQASGTKEAELQNWKQTFKDQMQEQILLHKETILKTSKDFDNKYKDTRDQTENTIKKMFKIKQDLEISVEQLKNNMNFEDGLIEQKVSTAVNKINDKLDMQINSLNQILEKTLADFRAQNTANLSTKIEQVVKLSQDSIKNAVSEEVKARKQDTQNLENQLKSFTDSILSRVTHSLEKEIENLSDRVHNILNEEEVFKEELKRLRVETAGTVEQMFSSIDDAKENIKQWSEVYTGKIVSDTKDEVRTLIEVEREILLKEIDKGKNEVKILVDNVHSNINKSMTEEAQLSKKIEFELNKEKEARNKELEGIMKRLEEMAVQTRESINSSSESSKTLCKALVTKEATERNKLQENILKNLQSQMTALEDLLKFYTSKMAGDIRFEMTEAVEEEKQARTNGENAQKQHNKKIKAQIKTQKDALEVELCVKNLIDSVVQINTMSVVNDQKKDMENKIKKWVEDFGKEIEDTSNGIYKELTKMKKDIPDEINAKIEVRAFIESLVSNIEKHDTNLGIQESHSNIEVLFRNMQKLEEFISISKDEGKKQLIDETEKLRDDMMNELQNLEKIDAKYYEDNKEDIEKLQIRVKELEKDENQKALNLMSEEVESLRMDLQKKEDVLNELVIRQDELNNQQIEFVKRKTEEDQELKTSVKILADGNADIDQKLVEFQKNMPKMMEQLNEHDHRLKEIAMLKEKVKNLDDQIEQILKSS